MNIDVLLKKEVEMPDFSDKEIYRYSGIKNEENCLLSIIDECKKAIEKELKSTVVYRILPIKTVGDVCDFKKKSVKSKHLAIALKEADYAVFMAATLGIGIDRLIYKFSYDNIAKAHICDSVATERIEALCDAFCRELDSDFLIEGYETGFRYSPGYGDLPIEFQKEIFSLLVPNKYIGLTLNDSLMMSPSKSVSAIVAVKRKE